MTQERQSPVFVRTYELLRWLLPHTAGWARVYRFTLTQEVVRTALRLQERLLEAALEEHPVRRLEQATIELEKVRLYLRLGYDLQQLSTDQYAHVSELIAHVGRLLGAWLRQSRSQIGGKPPMGDHETP